MTKSEALDDALTPEKEESPMAQPKELVLVEYAHPPEAEADAKGAQGRRVPRDARARC